MSQNDIPRVIIESPYRADTHDGEVRNLYYAHACIADCLRRGEAPMASHVLYTVALNDEDPNERALGIDAGFAWRFAANRTVVYTNLGITTGMRMGITHAKHLCQPVEFRSLAADEMEAVESMARDEVGVVSHVGN